MHQRFAELENNPVNNHVAKLQEQIEWIQSNCESQNAASHNLLEKSNFPFNEDIIMVPMPPRLKYPDIKYNVTGGPAEHIEIYKS